MQAAGQPARANADSCKRVLAMRSNLPSRPEGLHESEATTTMSQPIVFPQRHFEARERYIPVEADQLRSQQCFADAKG